MISTENSSLSWSGKVHRLMKTLSVINRVMVELRKKQAWEAFGSSAKCFYSVSLVFFFFSSLPLEKSSYSNLKEEIQSEDSLEQEKVSVVFQQGHL